MTLANNKNALIGSDVERLFKNTIVNQHDVIQKVKQYFNLKGDIDSAILSGIHGEKADVKIGFTCGHIIDVNIKAYKAKSGFNQLTRSSVKKFCTTFGLEEIDRIRLEKIIIDKSKDTKSDLFDDNEILFWNPIFNKKAKEMLKWGFSYKTSREILVLFNRDTSVMEIYPMKEILSKMSCDVVFTKGGFNIGRCVTFQRKGGNGSLSKTIHKHDIQHPGNNIQLKLKVAKFRELMSAILIAVYNTG